MKRIGKTFGPRIAPAGEALANTNLNIGLRGNKLILRGPMHNRELCIKMLKLAMEAIGDGAPTQTDAGPGGQRILIPTGCDKLPQLYLNGKRKIG